MKLWRRLCISLAVALLVLPLSVLAAFDLLWLQPRLEQIQTLAQSAGPEALNPPPLIEQMVRASEPNGLKWSVSRIVIAQSKPEPKLSTLQRHAIGATTALLLPLHAPEQELLALYCARIYVGDQSYGLEAAAQQLFGKNLAALNLEQAATVAAWPRAPSYYAKRPEALARLRDTLLERVSPATDQGL